MSPGKPRPDDEALFARFRRDGDLGALAELFDRLAPTVLRVALHLVRDPATAEDLVQDTFLRAIEVRDAWDEGRPLLPWLCGVLHNRARREQWRSGRAPDPARLPAPPVADPSASAQQAEFDAAVDTAIAELPEAYRPVLRFRKALITSCEPMAVPMIELRLRRIGNSLGIILPKEALEALGAASRAGEVLALAKLPDGRGFELRHVDASFAKKLALLRDTMKRYKNTLRALAK